MKKVELIGGNLLDFPTHCVSSDKYVGINAIAHSCNCQNVMGAGIAKQIKDRYPQAFEADTERWSNEYNDGGNWRCQIGDYSKAEITKEEFTTSILNRDIQQRVDKLIMNIFGKH